jgi:ABC-2 type transport system ATP-binding protein
MGGIGVSEYAIDLHHVEKVYRGRVRALCGISLQVHPREVFGLLGPNGAGKSTLVKIMMTVVRPTRVQGSILGKPVGDKPTLARVGYLPEHHRFPRYLTGKQVMTHYGALSGVDRATCKRRADELLDMVGMSAWRDKKISTYSKGMMQRVGLAQALINDPDLIVLDEPTDGVDPVGRREIRECLVALRDRGKTIMLNSHLLSEVETVCDRVSILVQGNVALQGTLEELTKDSRRYEIVINGPPPEWIAMNSELQTKPTSNGQTTIVLRSAEPADAQPLIDRLRHDQKTICVVRPIRENLEDLFMRAVTDPATGAARMPGAAAPQRKEQRS